MTDFTLVIPTYNRPKQLAALLTYLHHTPWPIHVLFSGNQPDNYPNGATSGNVEFYGYAVDTHPFDKFADGVSQVTTEYCALCADDDLVIPAGIECCLAVMRKNARIVACQGMGYSFLGDELIGIQRPFKPMTDDSPMARVATLMSQYRALTYAVYRTQTLQWVLREAGTMTSLLGKELLASALTAARGHVALIPCFTGGRNAGDSAHRYMNWHPTEWFVTDAGAMIREYLKYRTMLAHAIWNNRGNNLELHTITQILDVVHLRYLLGYMPREAMDFIIEEKTRGVIWSDSGWPKELQDMVIEAGQTGYDRPALSSDALKEIESSLQQYTQAMVDCSITKEPADAVCE